MGLDNGTVDGFDIPGMLEDAQHLAEIDGDAQLYADIGDAIDDYTDYRNYDETEAFTALSHASLTCVGTVDMPF